MMSDDELQKLGEHIKANGLQIPIAFYVEKNKEKESPPVLLDGRNRLEAMERYGVETYVEKRYIYKDPVAYVIGVNIERRHLTKQQQADLIVAAHRAAAKSSYGADGKSDNEVSRQIGGKPQGGRPANAVKAAAVVTAAEHGISKRTVERAFAKAEGRLQQSKPVAGPPLKPTPKLETHVGLEAARRHYLDLCAEPGVDLDAELKIIIDAFRELDSEETAQ
jgi:hypothetical protein